MYMLFKLEFMTASMCTYVPIAFRYKCNVCSPFILAVYVV